MSVRTILRFRHARHAEPRCKGLAALRAAAAARPPEPEASGLSPRPPLFVLSKGMMPSYFR